MNVIIFRNNNGSVGLIIPTTKTLEKYSIYQIADKDVPVGLKYKVVDSAILPDVTFRDAWTLPENFPYDGVGNKSNEFEINDSIEEIQE